MNPIRQSLKQDDIWVLCFVCVRMRVLMCSDNISKEIKKKKKRGKIVDNFLQSEQKALRQMTREEGQREELEDANRMMKMKMSSYKDWVHFFET